MRDRLEIGPTPAEESCAQVGSDRYAKVWRAECEAYRNQLRRMFGPEPDGASIVITSNNHDFGTYHDVAVSYDCDNRAALDYALKLESESPGEWDDAARVELTAKGVCTAMGCDHDTVGCVEYHEPVEHANRLRKGRV